MKPQAYFLFPLTQWDIFWKWIDKTFQAILALENDFKNSHFLLKHPIIFAAGEIFQSIWYECKAFSLLVHHSRFSTLLSFLIQFLWLTCGLLSGFGMYVRETSLWILKYLFHSLLRSHTLVYQFLSFFSFKNLFHPHHHFQGWLQTFPSSVTAYSHSYQGISFIKQNKKIGVSWAFGEHNAPTLLSNLLPKAFDINSILAFNNLQYA
jgi:hypothetical protein